jgi:phosphatidylglycerophosphatase A
MRFKSCGQKAKSGLGLFMKKLILALASGLGLGYSPIAPGTAGTLLGIVIFLGMGRIHALAYLIILFALFFFSCWLSARSEDILQKQDPQIVVIDEVVGFLVTMFTFPLNWHYILAGFLLFRFFDIVKIYPASYFDREGPPGYGVVLDDVISGIYANICLQIARLVFGA